MNITIILPAVQVVKRELTTSPQPTTTPFPPVSVTPSTSGSVTSEYQEILEEYHHHETTHLHHNHLSQSRIDHIAARQAAYDEEFEQQLLRREQAFSPAKSIPIDLEEEEEELQIISSRISSGHFTTESTSSPETVRTAVIRSPPKQSGATRDEGQERRGQNDTRIEEEPSLRSTFVEKSLHETDHETEIVNQGGERSLAGLKEGEENYDQNSSEDAQVTTLDGSEKKEDVRNGMDEVMTQQDILDELEELIIIKEEEGRDGKPHIVITTQGPDHIAELDDDDGNEYERKAVNKFNTGDDVGGKLDKEEENEGEIETHSSTTALPDSQDKADEEKEQDNSTTHQQVRKSSVPQDDHAPTSTTTSRPVLRRQSRQIFDPDVIPTSPPTKSDTRRASTHSDDDDEAKYQTNEKKRQSISKQRDDFTPYSDTESNESNNTVIAASAREATTPSPPHRTQDEQKTKRTTEKRHSLKKQSSDGNNNYTTTTTPSPPASRKGSDTVGENVRLSQAKRNPITDHDNHDGRQDSVPTSRRGSENFEKRDERQDSVPSSRRGSDNFAKREECQDSVPSSRKGSDTAVENVRLSQAKRDSIADHGNDVGRQGSLPSSRRGSDNAEKKEEHPHATMVRGQSIQKRDSTAGLHQGESGNNEKANYSQDGHQKKQASPPHGEEFRRGRSLEENKQEEEIVAKVREGAKRGSITGHPVEKVYDEATSSRRASKAEPAGDHSIQKRGSSDSDQETVQKRALGELSGEMHDQTVGKSHSSEENVSQEKKTPPKGQPVVVRRTSVVSPTKQVNYSQDKQHRSHQSPPIKQHSPDKQGHSRDDHQQVKHNQEHSQTTHKRSNNPPPKRQSSQQRSPPGSKHSPENKVQHGSQKSLENQNQQKSHQSKQHNSPENQTRSTQQLPPAEGSHQSPPDTQSQTRSHQSPPKRAHQSPPAKHSQESSHQSPQAHQKIQTRSSQSPPRVSHSQNDQIQARSHQSPPRHPHQSPPTQAHQSPPKQIHQSPPTHTHQSPPTQAHQSPPTHTHQSLPSKISPEKQIQARSHPSPPAEKSHDIEPHNPPQDKEHSPESHQQHGSPQSQPPPPTPQHHSSKTQHQPSTDNFSPEKKQEIHASPPTTRSYDGIQHQAHVQSPPEKQHSASDPQSQPLTQLPPIVTHSSAESQTPPQLIHSPPTKESAGSQTTSTHHPHHQTSPPTIKQPLQPTNNNNLGQKPGDHPTPKVRTATTTTTSHHPSSHKLPPEPQHQRSFKQPTYPHRMTKTTIARQALAREKRRAYVEERIQSYMRKSQYASANALHESYIMNKIRNGGLLPDMDSVAAHYGAEDLTAMREKGQGRRFTKLDPASMQSLPDINSYHHYATSYATSSSRRVPFSYHTDPLSPPPPQTLTAISIIKPPPQYYSPIDNSNNNTTTTTNDNHLPDPTTRSNTTSFQSTAETSQNSGIYIDSNPESTSNFWKNVSEQGFYYSFRVRQSGTVQMMDKSVQTGEQPQSYVLDFSRRPDGRYVLQNSRPVNLGSNSNHHHHHINNNHDTTTHLPPINNRDKILRDITETVQLRHDQELRRAELIQRANDLQSLVKEKREKINRRHEFWHKKYIEESSMTRPLEAACTSLRAELNTVHRRLIAHLEGRDLPLRLRDGPSKKANYKIMAARLQHEIKELQQKAKSAKLRLESEVKLKEQAEREVRDIRNDLAHKKVVMSLARSQFPAALAHHPRAYESLVY